MSTDRETEGPLQITGRIATASNASFLGQIGDVEVIYKPISGEKPLWDFADGTLAGREVAAFLVSEAFGWDIVPRTWLRDGPRGRGMVQLWREPDPHQAAVDLVASDAMPLKGWRAVFDGIDENDRPVTLIHEDSSPLRRMAVFDVVVNNADRKGAHILEMTDGHRHGVDHGLTFHLEHKLRTVLWGWIDQPLEEAELEGIDRVLADLGGTLGERLGPLIDSFEIAALASRCSLLMRRGTFPAPHGEMPALPWPLF